MVLALARHIFEHGVDGRFYSQVRRDHHEGGNVVYWSMDDTPEETDLINRCEEAQTWEARLAAGTLPKSSHGFEQGVQFSPRKRFKLMAPKPVKRRTR